MINESLSPEIVELRRQNLQKLQVPCSSSRPFFGTSTWQETEKLSIISNAVSEEYEERSGLCSVLYTKDFSKLKEAPYVVVISTHVDFVPQITQPFCYYSPETGMFKGTFDNSATNAALLSLMMEDELSDIPVVFAFTGDEETGRCTGAKEVISLLEDELGIEKEHMYPIALDVTYEGYRHELYGNPVTFTIENISYYDEHFVKIANDMMKDGRPYICAPKDAYPPGVKPICKGETSLYDEGVAYQEKTGHGLSFCMPVGGGSMHSNKGVNLEVGVYLGYIDSLKEFVKKYDLYLSNQKEKERASALSR